MTAWVVLARRVWCSGVSQLLYNQRTGEYWLTIKNRSYQSKFGPIPLARVPLWMRAFGVRHD